jgi:beta-lactam-binding protein with PASTA domain
MPIQPIAIVCGCSAERDTAPPERVRVPNVLGLAERAAIRKITRAHLCVQDVSFITRPVRRSVVVEQWPKAGALVRRRLRMALFVSQGGGGAGIYTETLGSFGNCPPTHYVLTWPTEIVAP